MQSPGFDVNLYFSGSVDAGVEKYLIDSNAYRLLTFAYPKEVDHYLGLAAQAGKSCRMMMDSGAFSAWNSGKEVTLRELCDYNDKVLARYPQHEFLFISLDVIPGDRGRKPTNEELAKSIEQSKQNFKVMQEHYKGRATVLPVYHTGEDLSLRNYYMELTDYICLSMDQTMSERDRLAWAKRVAVPGWRYHGLAATGNNMVTQIGWHSADSSSWVTVGSMGGLLWPVGNRFRVLPVSSNSPSRHEAGHHLTTLSAYERARAEDYIRSKGFDPDALATSYQYRWCWNAYQWLEAPWKRNIQKPVDLFEEIC
ncbi:MAG: hypothetical protein FKY71_08615 [Spiribacter salinus]|uniref:Uncharacterized protein n=1 Tax=Spiribacter salinus TaxID=1335746 RepID=A0A540VTF2_9GAMM|nr:MAG: hypothetical protein FKY71_08615 [Spiribacter salinus]